MIDLGHVLSAKDPVAELAKEADLSKEELLDGLGFAVVKPSEYWITRRTRYADILRGLISYHRMVADRDDLFDEYLEALKYALRLVERENDRELAKEVDRYERKRGEKR